MTQEQVDEIESIQQQQLILITRLKKITKDCDHKYTDGKTALHYIDRSYIDKGYSSCVICLKERL